MSGVMRWHTDKSNHANGTCKACGGPCAIYGCPYCPDCYETESPMIEKNLGLAGKKMKNPAMSYCIQ